MKHLLILLTAIVALTLPCEVAAQGIITRPTTKKEQPSNPTTKSEPAEKKTPALRQTCKNLDLYTTRDGECYFFSVDEWKALPESERNKFEKKGVVIKKDGMTFSLALNVSRRKMTWNEAMARYGDALPTKAQGEAMAEQCKAVNNAIMQFGGDKYPEKWYWKREEYGSSYAWYVTMNYGLVLFNYKTNSLRVRAVAPVPCSSAM